MIRILKRLKFSGLVLMFIGLIVFVFSPIASKAQIQEPPPTQITQNTHVDLKTIFELLGLAIIVVGGQIASSNKIQKIRDDVDSHATRTEIHHSMEDLRDIFVCGVYCGERHRGIQAQLTSVQDNVTKQIDTFNKRIDTINNKLDILIEKSLK